MEDNHCQTLASRKNKVEDEVSIIERREAYQMSRFKGENDIIP